MPSHQVEMLEDEAERRAPYPGEKALRQAGYLHFIRFSCTAKNAMSRYLRSIILPDVGRAMQPIRVRSVVFPEPLGPLQDRDPSRLDGEAHIPDGGKLVRFAGIETIW